MSQRTKDDYNRIWAFLKEKFPNFQPAVATTDFEKGLRQSLLDSFEGIHLVGCFFHYAQASIFLLLSFI